MSKHDFKVDQKTLVHMMVAAVSHILFNNARIRKAAEDGRMLFVLDAVPNHHMRLCAGWCEAITMLVYQGYVNDYTPEQREEVNLDKLLLQVRSRVFYVLEQAHKALGWPVMFPVGYSNDHQTNGELYARARLRPHALWGNTPYAQRRWEQLEVLKAQLKVELSNGEY